MKIKKGDKIPSIDFFYLDESGPKKIKSNELSKKKLLGQYGNINKIVVNKDKPFKDKWMTFCICGREYYNKAGYIAYDLYLPKFAKEGKAFSQEEDETIIFNANNHIDYAQKPTPVEDFGANKEQPEEFEL